MPTQIFYFKIFFWELKQQNHPLLGNMEPKLSPLKMINIIILDRINYQI